MAQFGQFALAIAFIVAIYAIVASLIGIRSPQRQADRQRPQRRHLQLHRDFDGDLQPRIPLPHQRFFGRLRRRPLQHRSAASLQDQFGLGRAGRLAAVLGLDSDGVFRAGHLPEPEQASLDDAVCHGGADGHVAVLHGDASVRGESFQHRRRSRCPAARSASFRPSDGVGLNPLLQDTLMVIHPPMLYTGIVGLAVPYAFAIAALITRQLGDTWIRTTRRWTMVAWVYSRNRHSAGRQLGVSRTGMGRLLGLGSGRECFADAVADRHGLPALGDGAGKERHAEGLEHRADHRRPTRCRSLARR